MIILSLRTNGRVGPCYGYKGSQQTEREFVPGILGSAGANDVAQKIVSARRFAATAIPCFAYDAYMEVDGRRLSVLSYTRRM